MDQDDSTPCVNPLALSLEEVIAFNKARNIKNEEENQSLDEIIRKNKIRNLQNELKLEKGKSVLLRNRPTFAKGLKNLSHADFINRRLRNTPGFGSRSIHKRLGYFHFKRMRKRIYPSAQQALANKYINRAKIDFWRRRPPVNPTISFTNPNAHKIKRLCGIVNTSFLNDFINSDLSSSDKSLLGPGQRSDSFRAYVSPLTRQSVGKFDRMNGSNGQSMNETRSVSNYSAVSRLGQARHMTRHSVRASLNPSLQETMMELPEPVTTIEKDTLEDYTISPDWTSISINERFLRYT